MALNSSFSFPEFAYEELNHMVILNSPMDSPILDEEATLESNMTFHMPEIIPETPEIAPPRVGPPDRTPVNNACNFKVEISSGDTNKKKYLYSSHLNRIYVNMNCDFAVQFSWRAAAAPAPALVRATVVFTDEAQAEKRVERCVQHRHDNSDLCESIRMHVLRSSRELGTRGVHYQGGAAADCWYSVVVEMPAPAAHAYRFVCKNSCSSGINRRPISIVFTLEDRLGNVYGREITSARVCSCPRRDLLKDEEHEGIAPAPGKRRAPAAPARSKKVKLEDAPSDQPRPLDQNILTLPQLQVVGSNVVATGLEVMVRMMEQGMSARPHDAQYAAQCGAAIHALNAAIQQYRGQ